MAQLKPQDMIDLSEVKIDPLTCVNCIDWAEVPISNAKKDLEQGRLLEEKTFEGISWNEYPGSLTALISKILKKLPESKEYYHVTQGFSDALVNDLMKAIKRRDLQNGFH